MPIIILGGKVKNIITLTGDLASGKSTISKILAEKLGYEIYRNGTYFRQLAKEHNMDVTEFNQYVDEHPEEKIDEQIEFSAEKYAKEHDNLIIDARLGYFSVPESFKLYLKVDIDVAAQRAFNDIERKDSENHSTIEEQKQDMIKRRESEKERYLKTYNIDITDLSNFDLVLDTTNMTIDEEIDTILKHYYKWQQNNNKH